jgi:transposase
MKNKGGKNDQWTKLPVKVGRADFNKYIDPYLSKAKRGPKGKISRCKIFNYILYVLHTGMQWNELKPERNEICWTNIYKWHSRWSKDGSYENLFLNSLFFLERENLLDTSIIHGDGSNTVAKKGVKAWDIRDGNIRKA